MSQLQLPIQPEDASKQILKKLPSRRMRDVLEKRFGLKGGRKKTLEAIGKEYKITRERVRQIETEALKQLSKPENHQEIEPLLRVAANHILEHGEVMAEGHLVSFLPPKQIPYFVFLLHVGKPFMSISETQEYQRRWAVNKATAAQVEKLIDGLVGDLEKRGVPVPEEELNSLFEKNAKEILGHVPEAHVAKSYLSTSKYIKMNPYGEFGHIVWPTISPRGVKDKAYLVLAKSGKPMHFREVAGAINSASWSKKKAHPQTVHNELIKDERFVLVGRGLYALSEWGYHPGTVRDVLVSVFTDAGKPLHRDEVIELVMQKRMVKAPTILLNLQNKSVFKRIDGGKYMLA